MNVTNVFGTVVMLWIRGGYLYLFVILMEGVRVGGRLKNACLQIPSVISSAARDGDKRKCKLSHVLL